MDILDNAGLDWTSSDITSLPTVTAVWTSENANNNSRSKEAGSDDLYASQLPQSIDIVLATYMAFIAVGSILLNGLVLGTIAGRNRKLVSLDIYIVNLSVIDLLHASLGHPLMVAAALKHAWPFSVTVCHYYAATVFFLGTASISTLAAMSVMRYIKVCHTSLDKYITVNLGKVTLIPIYLNASVWSIAPLLGWASYGPEPFGLSCTLDWFNPSQSYIVCIFLGVYIIPLVAMVTCYGKMVYDVYKAQSQSSLFRTRMDKYLTKMTVIMCSCFMLAWTPYSIVAFIYVFYPGMQVPHTLTVAAPFLAKSSTCYNPIVYFLYIKRFRKDAMAVFCTRFTKKEQPSPQTEEIENNMISMSLRSPQFTSSSKMPCSKVRAKTTDIANTAGQTALLPARNSNANIHSSCISI